MTSVRGFSDFGFSYVYVIFEDGTDVYWARTRVLEYLSKITPQLPQDVKVELGPDATTVGWVFQYALVDRTGRHALDDLLIYRDEVGVYLVVNASNTERDLAWIREGELNFRLARPLNPVHEAVADNLAYKARSAGTIYPIIRNVPGLYGSKPNDASARKIGSYVMWIGVSASAITSSLFLTALAPNVLAVEIARRTVNVDIDWLS